MISWFLNLVPWYVWAASAASLIVIFWPFVLTAWQALPSPVRKVLLAVGTLGLVYVAGRHTGWREAQDAQEKRDAAAKQKRAEIDADVAQRDDKRVRSDLDKWMRRK